MVALVRLLGHEGLPFKEMRDKVEPLVEKFGRDRLQEAADEIVETIGDGDDAIVQLTEEAHKFAIQLIGRPRPESCSTVAADRPSDDSRSSAYIASEALQPTLGINSATDSIESSLSPSTTTSPTRQGASTPESAESSPAPIKEQSEHGVPEWANYETGCAAAFLGQDREFVDQCLHLAKLCYEQAARCESVISGLQTESQTRTLLLAEQLQRLVCEYNPLAEDDSPFADLLEAALANVDWHDLANSFLHRLADEPDES